MGCAFRVVLAALAVASVAAINFDLAPGKEECFFEEVHQDTNINGAYAVTQGSHLDIDVQVFDPESRLVFNAKREGEGKFRLRADKDGTYKFCFSNKVCLEIARCARFRFGVYVCIDGLWSGESVG